MLFAMLFAMLSISRAPQLAQGRPVPPTSTWRTIKQDDNLTFATLIVDIGPTPGFERKRPSDPSPDIAPCPKRLRSTPSESFTDVQQPKPTLPKSSYAPFLRDFVDPPTS